MVTVFNDVEINLHGYVAHKISEHIAEQLSTVLEYVDGYGATFAMKCHGRDQTRQAETVVAMEMADEYVLQARHAQVHPRHHGLCPFSTVNHI